MSVILLVRHGQASWGAADYDQLSALGEEQSRVLGATLAARGVNPDLLLVGAMKRHRQTAEAAVEGAGWTGTELEVDDGWNEFDHQQMMSRHPIGLPEGHELTHEEFQRWFEAATLRWTGGEHAEDYDEPFDAFEQRVDAALRRVGERLGRKETAVVFTSGGPISWATASLLGQGAELWRTFNPVCVNASVTKVVLGRRGSTLVSFNDHSHLELAEAATGAGTELVSYR